MFEDIFMVNLINNSPDLWKKALPLPNKDSHKHNRGHLLITGSRHMTGASRLTAAGARRMGCGLVYLAVPNEVVHVYMADSPGNIIIRAEDSGAFRSAIRSSNADAIIVGPGMRETDITRDIIQRALISTIPTIVDAGGLGVFTNKVNRLQKVIAGPVVVTPHLGEYERLFGKDDKSAPEKAISAANFLNATVVLKGSKTYIASPDGRVAETAEANPWLATGGTGDVLTGIIGALVAQKMEPFLAACAAVWFHRRAADIIGVGLIAEDIPNIIPTVWREIL